MYCYASQSLFSSDTRMLNHKLIYRVTNEGPVREGEEDSRDPHQRCCLKIFYFFFVGGGGRGRGAYYRNFTVCAHI